jgi:hypothetical protein
MNIKHQKLGCYSNLFIILSQIFKVYQCHDGSDRRRVSDEFVLKIEN